MQWFRSGIAWLISYIYASNVIFQIFPSEFKHYIVILNFYILTLLKYFQEAYWVWCFAIILHEYVYIFMLIAEISKFYDELWIFILSSMNFWDVYHDIGTWVTNPYLKIVILKMLKAFKDYYWAWSWIWLLVH